jgi:hypothetical protein
VNRELNDPSDVHPTAKQTSVTDRSPRRNNAFARSIRRVMTYPYGVSPKAARKLREKCPADINATRARAGTSSGSAYSRSTRSRTRRSRTSSSNVMNPESHGALTIDRARSGQPRTRSHPGNDGATGC